MKVQGLLESLAVDGYERTLGIRSGDELLYCTALQTDEYLESGAPSTMLTVGQPISVDVALCLASISSAESRDEVGLVQDISGSPHAIVTGDVLGVTGVDSCVLELHNQGELPIEFELPVNLLPEVRIRVVGELTVISE